MTTPKTEQQVKLYKTFKLKNIKKKIFIFGSGGEVGSDLVKLFSTDYLVYAFQRTKKKKDLKNSNVKYILHDFKKPIKTKVKPLVIINCIVTHDFSKQNNFSDLILNNCLSILHIVQFAKLNKIKIIHLSSVVIFNNFNKKKLLENSSLPDTNLLGSLKLLAEKSISFENLQFINLRLPGVLCESINNTRPWLRKNIYDIKKNKNILVFNKNSSFNNLITSKELFRFIDSILKRNIFQKGTYNFSANKAVKIKDLLNLVKNFYRSSSKINFSNIKKNSFIINSTKLEKKFKFKIKTTEKLLLEYLSDLKNL